MTARMPGVSESPFWEYHLPSRPGGKPSQPQGPLEDSCPILSSFSSSHQAGTDVALDMPQMIGLFQVAPKGMDCWLLVCVSAVHKEYNIPGWAKREILAVNGCVYILLTSFFSFFSLLAFMAIPANLLYSSICPSQLLNF